MDKPSFPAKLEEPVGYDFVLQNWMPPYGKGQHEDVLITIRLNDSKKAGGPQASVEYAFTGQGNGVCGIPLHSIVSESQFQTPYEAPENGYENNPCLLTERLYPSGAGKPVQKSNIEGENFFFRIRTQYDDEGNVVSGLYGIILDKIQIIIWPKQNKIMGLYWLNPTPNDRNLEPARDERGQIIPYKEPLPQ